MRTRRYQPRTCERCGREYVPTSANQKYCGAMCKELSRRKQKDIDREAERLAVEAVGALDDDQRMRLKALLAGKNQWLRLAEEVVLS